MNFMNFNKNRRGHNFIGVAMQPEALVAATLAGMKEFYDKPHIHFEDSSI